MRDAIDHFRSSLLDVAGIRSERPWDGDNVIFRLKGRPQVAHFAFGPFRGHLTLNGHTVANERRQPIVPDGPRVEITFSRDELHHLSPRIAYCLAEGIALESGSTEAASGERQAA